jgi:transcriptional regulator with XRE-family HTH domain
MEALKIITHNQSAATLKLLYNYRIRLGGAIRVIRSHKDIKQDYAAYQTGMTQSNFSKIENGLVSIASEDLLLIASAIKTTPQQLVYMATADKNNLPEFISLTEILVKFIKVLENENEEISFSDDEFHLLLSRIEFTLKHIATKRSRKMG